MTPLPDKYSKEWEQTQIQRFDLILDRDLSSLLRETSTEFNFLEIKEQLVNVRDQVFTIVQDYTFWIELPENKRRNLNASLDDMNVVFVSMEMFDPKQNSAWELRNHIIQDFNNRYNSFYDQVVVPLNVYLGRKAYSKELTSKFGQEAKKELGEIRRVKKEIESLQTEVGRAAAIAGDVASAAHAISFGEQAIEHKRFAKLWLWAVIIAMAVSLGISTLVVIDIVNELTDTKTNFDVRSGTIKLTILAFFYLIIRFTTKNYYAHRHQYIINKQRANALQSVEAFRSSAVGDGTKDTVLLAAVGAAYSHQETGYISTKEGAGSDDSNLIRVIESTIKK